LSSTSRTGTLSTARSATKTTVTKRTDPPPTSDKDSVFSKRDDKSGGAFKRTHDDDDDNDDDESSSTNDIPNDDDGGAFDRQRQSKAAPAETPRSKTDIRGPVFEASKRGTWWSTETRTKARATTNARDDDDDTDDDEKSGLILGPAQDIWATVKRHLGPTVQAQMFGPRQPGGPNVLTHLNSYRLH
jgi:hypothetical protein